MKKYRLIFITVFTLLTIAFCKQPEIVKEKTRINKQVNKTEITVNELQHLIKTDSNTVILDVRTSEELTGQLGHIKGVINIPVQVLNKRISELGKYKDNKIYVICRSGHRSALAVKILIKKGFNAINVLGGMIN